jgi:asparagine synthase (glutamine-hydrolysing)
MCGIFGFASKFHEFDISVFEARLKEAQLALDHRGPDDRGLEIFPLNYHANNSFGALAMGQTRLSIIDLSSAGHQPMNSYNGRYTIVFNGEIYNYKELRSELKAEGQIFNTDTDTEVLIVAWARWGISGLKRLIGMFAFAIYDRLDQSLTLVRDAFGMKPLFYSKENMFSFASEIPALLKLIGYKVDINLQQAYNYLVYGIYDSSDTTFFSDINQLMPAHLIRINLCTGAISKPVRWWKPSIKEENNLSFSDAADQLREIFLNNVRLHLRSDVPVGATLSGGLDSSAIVCSMRHLEPDMPIHTFTYVAEDSNVNEEYWANIVNIYLGAIPHKVLVNPRDLEFDLEDMVSAQGEPFGTTSIYAQYRVFKAAREAGITVMLDGQGADELFAGYDGYPSHYIRSLIELKKYKSIAKFLFQWSRWPNRNLIQAIFNLGLATLPTNLNRTAWNKFKKSNKPSWLDLKWMTENQVNLDYPNDLPLGADGRGRRLVEHLRNVQSERGLTSLLRHADRNSMRWSIESRMPFLTIELAEFMLKMPESFLLSEQGQTKHVFRAAMRGIVPDEILDRRDKIGFQTPEHQWLTSQETSSKKYKNYVSKSKFINQITLQNLQDQHLKDIDTKHLPVWRLLNYETWYKLLIK